jgi:hypothetical protein
MIAGCGSLSVGLNNIPSWYLNPSESHPNIFNGYGSGVTLADARSAALVDLAQQIEVEIRSSTNSQNSITKISETININSRHSTESYVTSNLTLTDYEILNHEKIFDKHYVWLQHDNRSLDTRLSNFLKICPTIKISPFDDLRINRLLNRCSWRLVRNSGSWKLIINGEGKNWTIHPTDIKNFFFGEINNIKNGVKFELVSNTFTRDDSILIDIKEGDSYFIRILNIDGFDFEHRKITFFQINQLGQVVALPFDYLKQKNIYFPDPNFYDGLIAELNFLDDQVSTDLILMADCSTSLDLSAHRYVNDIVSLTDESLYTFGRLFEDLEICNISSKTLRILPKK